VGGGGGGGGVILAQHQLYGKGWSEGPAIPPAGPAQPRLPKASGSKDGVSGLRRKSIGIGRDPPALTGKPQSASDLGRLTKPTPSHIEGHAANMAKPSSRRGAPHTEIRGRELI